VPALSIEPVQHLPRLHPDVLRRILNAAADGAADGLDAAGEDGGGGVQEEGEAHEAAGLLRGRGGSSAHLVDYRRRQEVAEVQGGGEGEVLDGPDRLAEQGGYGGDERVEEGARLLGGQGAGGRSQGDEVGEGRKRLLHERGTRVGKHGDEGMV